MTSDSRFSPRRQFYALMVWNMRWMTRHLGFLTRPFLRWYARQEVIACGLRREDGRVTVIYSPDASHLDHRVLGRGDVGWQKTTTVRSEDFSGGLVQQVCLHQPETGRRYRVHADRPAARLPWQRRVSSPLITVKPATVHRPELLAVTPRPGGELTLSWHIPSDADPMIFFLALETGAGEALVGVYTRELEWTYPQVERASLALVPGELLPLTADELYAARLVFVDYDGWVSHLAEVEFRYQLPA